MIRIFKLTYGRLWEKGFATIFAKRIQNQGEKYKNSLGTFKKVSYGKRKASKINIRSQDQMGWGILSQKMRGCS